MSPLLRIPRPAGAGDDTGVPGESAVEAVPRLFRAHGADLVRLGYCLTGDRGAAEEAVQDAFVSLYRHWDGVRDRSALLPYLRACVVNSSRSAHRRRASRVVATEQLTPELAVLPGADDGAERRERTRLVADAVRALPQRQREVVVCRFYLGLTERETAEMLEISLGSVKKHGSRAMARLQESLGVIR